MLEQSSRAVTPSVQKPNDAPRWFAGDQLERILVVVTLIAVVASIIAERLEAPHELILLINIVSYIAGGWFGVQGGIKSLRHREINIDLLMVLAALGAASVNQWQEGAILLFLFSLSNVLQKYAMERSRNAIRALLKLRPNQATVHRHGEMVVVPVESLGLGDIVVIKPGERFPIDGEIISGTSNIDQSTITGESMPVTKTVGEGVFAGTVNLNGSLEIKVTRAVNDTTLSRIIKMVEDAQGQRAHTQRFLDEFEQKYAMGVIAVVALFIVIPPLLPGGPTFSANFYRAMVLMTVASPCALVISTPASILSAIANAARRGVLFKGGVHLETMATLKVIAFDKTGTITTGKPAVTDILPYGDTDPVELLRITASLESRSEHPIASALVGRAHTDSLTLTDPLEFDAIAGMGVHGVVDGKTVFVGTERLMNKFGLAVPPELLAFQEHSSEEGKSVLFTYADQWLGAIAVADELRPGAAEVLRSLKAAGIQKIVILTGDNERAARSMAQRVGADEVRANLLPEQKVEAVKALQAQYGPTAMVGDGVNDAPALACAEIGIAMGAAGTDVALETADLVLMSDDLSNIAYAMHLSRKARRVVFQNLAFSLSVIVVLVISALVLRLELPLGVVGHEGSTLVVVANGLRLLAFKNPVRFV